MLETVLFYMLAALVLGLGLVVVSKTNPLASAMALVGSFAGLAGLYALLNAPVVAVLQILVYAGGIMVLMIFVIMLLNLHPDELRPLAARPLILGGTVLATLMGLALPVVVWVLPSGTFSTAPIPEGFGSLKSLADLLFGPYLFAFEALSLVLLVAVVGALVLSKKRL